MPGTKMGRPPKATGKLRNFKLSLAADVELQRRAKSRGQSFTTVVEEALSIESVGPLTVLALECLQSAVERTGQNPEEIVSRLIEQHLLSDAQKMVKNYGSLRKTTKASGG